MSKCAWKPGKYAEWQLKRPGMLVEVDRVCGDVEAWVFTVSARAGEKRSVNCFGSADEAKRMAEDWLRAPFSVQVVGL